LPKELVRPDPTTFSKVIGDAVVPALRDIERDLGRDLPTSVVLWMPHMEGPRVLLIPATAHEAAAPPKPLGEMRLSFRETAVPGRYLFFGEAIYERDVVPGKPFSGFDIQGVVWKQGDELKVKEDIRTIKFQEWQFAGWK